MKRIITTIAAAGILAASASAASAACAARDLGGDWQFYNTWWEDGIGLNWSHCVVSMDKTGAVLSVTGCVDSDFGGFDSPVWDGAMTITPDCVMTGFIEFGETEAESRVEISHATMDGRKSVIAGVGTDVEVPPTYWTFTMIEK